MVFNEVTAKLIDDTRHSGHETGDKAFRFNSTAAPYIKTRRRLLNSKPFTSSVVPIKRLLFNKN